MNNIKKNERYIPTKNYVIAAVITLGAILLTWYGFAWYNVLEENKMSQSYLVKKNIVTKEIDNLNELKDVFAEAPDKYLVYISYTKDQKVYDMEKDIAPIIKKNNLNEILYYIDVTNIKEEKNYIDKLNKTLKLKNAQIEEVPTFVYFVDGKVSKGGIISSADGKMMNINDFQKFLDVNKIIK